nr:flagellar filament capping protein FliD [uncultured Rhodoferax sp.]
MASITSVGIGSGLDVNSIVTQLVDLEKKPLKTLESKATSVQAQLSAFGQVQSQFAALTDVATRISDASTWTARTATSSNTSAATIAVTSSASANSFTLDVDRLASKQSLSSSTVTTGSLPGAGTLSIQLGTWDAAGTAFTAGGASAVNVAITNTDTLASIASKINAANSGVTASVFNDGTNERLLMQSKNTGAAAGFRVQSGDAALAGFVFDPENKAGQGMASSGNPVQFGQNAAARINGLAVTSATNTLADNFTGVTLELQATTTTNYGLGTETKAPITMVISEDVKPAVKNVSDFVDAFNKLNQTLRDLTKYDATTKVAGLFQGDSMVIGIQNVLRNMVGSTSKGATSQRLADIGLDRQLDGSLTINTAKLSVAANDGTSLQQLFTADNGNTMTNGFALKFSTLGQGVAATGGSLYNKAASLQNLLDKNSQDQTKLNARVASFEARLRKQYSDLDVQMAKLNALNTYVGQQVTLWNKSSN